METSYRPSPLLLGCLLTLLWWPPSASSITLCDGDCTNNTELEICEHPPDSPGIVPLPVMAFFPCNTDGFRARGLTVAAQMALKAVLRNTSILPGYRLELSFNNTMCSRLPAVRSFISQLRTTRYMIIGPGCSTGALPVAEIAPYWNLTQVSYTATSITLSDKRRFPNFLRVIPSDTAASATVMNVVREFDWEQVAIVTHINAVFSNLTTTMRTNLAKQDVSVLTERLFFRPFIDNTRDIVEQLNISGARIVVLNMFENFAREVFCLAYKRGMLFPRYVFISHYWYTEYWWTFPISRTTDHRYTPENCTVMELTNATFGSLAVDFFPMANGTGDEPTDVGTTPNQFWTDFVSNLTALNYLRSEAIRQAGFAYDSVWLAALALHNASMELENRTNGTRRLSDFTYADNEINHIILSSAIGVNFRGVTGNVRINEFGDREPRRQVFQYRFTEVVDPENTTLPPPFARLDPNSGNLLYLPGENRTTVFPDGVPLATLLVLINPALFILFTTLSCLGILFAFACLIFNLVFREKQLVKLSSPYLNVIITVGAMFFYVDVIISGVDANTGSFNTEDIICQTRIWVATIGFTLFFGPILAKAFRVYYIFRSIKLKKKPIKDWVLYLIVGVFVGVDVIMLSIVSVWRIELQSRLLQRGNGEIPQRFMECRSDTGGPRIWIPILLAYKGLFLVVGLFLAVQTYNVKIKKLRDSKLIVASVFSITVITIAITLVAFLVTNIPDVQYSVLGVCILLLVTGILILLFVTKMIELYRNPSGEIDLSSRPKTSESQATQPQENLKDKAKITELRETIQSLKAEIEALKQKENSGKDPLQTNHADEHSTEQKLNLKFNGTDLVAQNPNVKVDEDKL